MNKKAYILIVIALVIGIAVGIGGTLVVSKVSEKSKADSDKLGDFFGGVNVLDSEIETQKDTTEIDGFAELLGGTISKNSFIMAEKIVAQSSEYEDKLRYVSAKWTFDCSKLQENLTDGKVSIRLEKVYPNGDRTIIDSKNVLTRISSNSITFIFVPYETVDNYFVDRSELYSFEAHLLLNTEDGWLLDDGKTIIESA